MKRDTWHQGCGVVLGLGVGLCFWSWSSHAGRTPDCQTRQAGQTEHPAEPLPGVTEPHELFVAAIRLRATDPYNAIKLLRRALRSSPLDGELHRRSLEELRHLGIDPDARPVGH